MESDRALSRDLHARVSRLEIEQCRRHIEADAALEIGELCFALAQLDVCTLHSGTPFAALEDRHAQGRRDGVSLSRSDV